MQITCNTSSAYHVQHVVYHVLRRDSSAIKFDRVEIAFILAMFHWLKPQTDKGWQQARLSRQICPRHNTAHVSGTLNNSEPTKPPVAAAMIDLFGKVILKTGCR